MLTAQEILSKVNSLPSYSQQKNMEIINNLYNEALAAGADQNTALDFATKQAYYSADIFGFRSASNGSYASPDIVDYQEYIDYERGLSELMKDPVLENLRSKTSLAPTNTGFLDGLVKNVSNLASNPGVQLIGGAALAGGLANGAFGGAAAAGDLTQAGMLAAQDAGFAGLSTFAPETMAAFQAGMPVAQQAALTAQGLAAQGLGESAIAEALASAGFAPDIALVAAQDAAMGAVGVGSGMSFAGNGLTTGSSSLFSPTSLSGGLTNFLGNAASAYTANQANNTMADIAMQTGRNAYDLYNKLGTDVLNKYSTQLSPIQQGFMDSVNGIQGMFSDAANTITSAGNNASSQYDKLGQQILGVGQQANGQLQGIANTYGAGASTALGQFNNIAGGVTSAGGVAANTYNQIAGELLAAGNTAMDKFASIGADVGAAGTTAANSINSAAGALGGYAQGLYGDLTNAANVTKENTKFTPYAMSSLIGDTSVDANGNASMSLASPLKSYYDTMIGLANKSASGMTVNPDDMANKIYSQMQAVRSPQNERDRLAMESRLAAQGRLGTATAAYGGTPEALAMEKAIQEQMSSDALNSQLQARNMISQDLSNTSGMLTSAFSPVNQLSNQLSQAATIANNRQNAVLQSNQLYENMMNNAASLAMQGRVQEAQMAVQAAQAIQNAANNQANIAGNGVSAMLNSTNAAANARGQAASAVQNAANTAAQIQSNGANAYINMLGQQATLSSKGVDALTQAALQSANIQASGIQSILNSANNAAQIQANGANSLFSGVSTLAQLQQAGVLAGLGQYSTANTNGINALLQAQAIANGYGMNNVASNAGLVNSLFGNNNAANTLNSAVGLFGQAYDYITG